MNYAVRTKWRYKIINIFKCWWFSFLFFFFVIVQLSKEADSWEGKKNRWIRIQRNESIFNERNDEIFVWPNKSNKESFMEIMMSIVNIWIEIFCKFSENKIVLQRPVLRNFVEKAFIKNLLQLENNDCLTFNTCTVHHFDSVMFSLKMWQLTQIHRVACLCHTLKNRLTGSSIV